MPEDLTASYTQQPDQGETMERAFEQSIMDGVTRDEEDQAPPTVQQQEATPSRQVEPEEAPTWARDLRDSVQSLERRATYERYQQPQGWGYEQQYMQPPQQQQPQIERQPSRMLTDLDGEQFAQKMEQLERYQKAMVQGFAHQESQSFKQAESMLKQRYPDFDEVVPPEQRQVALRSALQAGKFGNDWATNMANAYKMFAFDKHFAQKDELAGKREQKKEEQKAKAAQIPPAGANYQAPAPKLEPGKRGYRDADRAFLEGLRAGL